MSILDDFFGAPDTRECVYCGGTDGELVPTIHDDVTGDATHHAHPACLAKAEAKTRAQQERAQRDVAMQDERDRYEHKEAKE